MASCAYRVDFVRSIFLPRQHVSMDIRNHCSSIRNRDLGIRNHRLGIRNPHVGIDRQLSLKWSC
jgi:hypothetical protein